MKGGFAVKRFCAFLLLLLLTVSAVAAEPAPLGEIVRQYQSDTLVFTMDRFVEDGARCYLTRIWMADPGAQIHKAASPWRKSLWFPSDMVKSLKVKAMLAVNGSGYVSPQFPWVPDDYPGKNRSYFYTPLGSLTITNGKVLRQLDGVAYYGLTLQADGLHLHRGEDPAEVLKQNPTQTWSFYDGCVLIDGGESVVDRSWKFANERNIRTIVGKLGDQDYFLLTVTNKENEGLSLVACTDWMLEKVHPLWAYDLDGGPSSALLVRDNPKAKLKTVYGNNSKDVDVMAFSE